MDIPTENAIAIKYSGAQGPEAGLFPGAAIMEETRILDGKALAALIVEDLSSRVRALKGPAGRAPGLGVILVGENPASKTYVHNKEQAARKAGFETFNQTLPADATEGDVREAIHSYNLDTRVDGILLQLPLPKNIKADPCLDLIAPEKDADGLHPLNQGLLVRGDGIIRPCTPAGVMRLIDVAFDPQASGGVRLSPPADLGGKKAIVIGRSILVGKPLATMLLQRNATVIMAHSKTVDLPALSATCDIVVAAVGVPLLVKAAWVKKGAVVIDVGINRGSDGKLVGDVEFAETRPVASAITPVPGGVGPMTIAMLLENTFQIYSRKFATTK